MKDQNQTEAKHPPNRHWSALPAALLSLIIPGSGQIVFGRRARGITLLSTIFILTLLILWQHALVLFVPLGLIWLWSAWDAWRLAGGHTTRLGVPILLAAFAIYGLGISATEVHPSRLVSGWPSVKPYLQSLTQPELMTHPTHDIVGQVPLQVPCITPLPKPDKPASEHPRLTISDRCAKVGDTVAVDGYGFTPNFSGEIWWVNPIGDEQRVFAGDKPLTFTPDANGHFHTEIKVPLVVPLTSLPKPGETQTHVIRAEQHKPYGPWEPTQTLSLVLAKIGETIALAFIATILGIIFALPVSFLAARNLMWGNPITRVIYYVVRTLLNIVRSIETLMWAIVFAVWVGLGPFDGSLALLFHTIAALGKLYSEAIENIDPGPIEAVRATGATGPQVVVYAVLPQFLPAFFSFTLYRWDINVRMSTVIGLVSDAGIGFLIIQWIRLNRFSSMATAIIAIVLVVAILDYASAWLRERVIAGKPLVSSGNPLRRQVTTVFVVLAFIATFAWSWKVAEINLMTFIEGAPAGLHMMRDFMVPEMFTRPTEKQSVSATLPVPCGAGKPTPPAISGPRVNLSLSCGNVGENLIITGHELPPDTLVSVRWVLSDGAYLRVKKDCCTTDKAGNLRLETKIHPLMQVNAKAGRPTPGRVVITWKKVIGGPRFSDEFKMVVNLSLVTLLMALLATTLGSIIAIPLSFFAARNIMGHSALGRSTYYTFRTLFNLWRSIEPMILALICAAWVGVGPFAGVLALAINNVPNLGKLFSETIEDIDTGPVEAITATGANRLQTLVYAIVPQLVPRFLAFILYQWDINIRMSTVIGYVGGGGIGQQFRLWVGLNQYSAAGMAVWAIVAMVWSMDYLSARSREKLV